MGAKIYGNTTIGPYSKAGGEINTAVFQAFSNKSHDGYLGHSVLGEWCNIGAGATSSNLKNNYSEVKLWNYNKNSFENTGSQFCGLIMGDHSKAGINTMFNTGTVVGVSSNVFGAGFPKNFIPSFSWGGSSGYKTYTLEKSLETARIVMARRSKTLTKQDELILEHVFHKTSSYRNWEI
jgi:UDP-N-acetylglucosamine diphosphorylase/glucosamine-1-phosphate N-acetyltransferase